MLKSKLKSQSLLTAFLICAIISFGVQAHSIPIGKVSIKAPHLEDFVLIAKESDVKFFNLFQTFTTPNNHLQVAYVQTDAYNKLKAGRQAQLKNYKLVQTVKKLESYDLSSKDFQALKNKVKKDWLKIVAKAQQQFPETMDRISRDIKSKYAVDYDFDIKGMVPIDMMETDNSVTTFNIASVKNEKMDYKMVMANTMLAIKGKLVVLLSYRKFENLNDIEVLKESVRSSRDLFFQANPF